MSQHEQKISPKGFWKTFLNRLTLNSEKRKVIGQSKKRKSDVWLYFGKWVEQRTFHLTRRRLEAVGKEEKGL